MTEMFENACRTTGDMAGVFEFDGETGYFYLYDLRAGEDSKVVGAIRMLSGTPEFSEADVSIKWDSEERYVGFFVRGCLCAAFDSVSGEAFGGDYRPDAAAQISPRIADA